MKLEGGLRDPTETMGIETNVRNKCDKLSLSFEQWGFKGISYTKRMMQI